MIKIATHVHTAPLSGCAAVPAAEVPALYKAKGYSAIVVTNHYMDDVFERYYGISDEKAQLGHFLSGYLTAKEAGEKIGLKVWLGAELNPARYNRPERIYPVREFLIYGLTEELVCGNLRLYDLSQRELFEFCEENGLFMLQAHPFRLPTEPGEVRFMHGCETDNLNPRHDSRNPLAHKWAEEHNFLKVAGDDFHEYGDEGRAATLAPEGTESYADFLRALQEGRTETAVLL